VIFFFFQAEDGIRDGHVTGVQTCALPISGSRRRMSRLVGECCPSNIRSRACTYKNRPAHRTIRKSADEKSGRKAGRRRWHPARRSEERRVGKEGRYRW